MTEVKREQFKWDGDKLIHKPTGAYLFRNSSLIIWGAAGERLDDGECYERDDLYELGHQMILENHTPE